MLTTFLKDGVRGRTWSKGFEDKAAASAMFERLPAEISFESLTPASQQAILITTSHLEITLSASGIQYAIFGDTMTKVASLDLLSDVYDDPKVVAQITSTKPSPGSEFISLPASKALPVFVVILAAAMEEMGLVQKAAYWREAGKCFVVIFEVLAALHKGLMAAVGDDSRLHDSSGRPTLFIFPTDEVSPRGMRQLQPPLQNALIRFNWW